VSQRRSRARFRARALASFNTIMPLSYCEHTHHLTEGYVARVAGHQVRLYDADDGEAVLAEVG
jgi:hypothetical protein